MSYFRDPFALNVAERSKIVECKTDEEDVGAGIRQRSETVVIFLPGGVPETDVDGFTVYHDVAGIVVKHGWNVFTWEAVGGVRDEKT